MAVSSPEGTQDMYATYRIAFGIVLLVASAVIGQDSFVETFNGSGENRSIQILDFNRQLVGQAIHGLDNPNWWIRSDGTLEEGGYRFNVHPEEPNDSGDFFETADLSHDLEIQSADGFVERIEFRDFSFHDDDSHLSSVGLAWYQQLGQNADKKVGIVISENIDFTEEPNDTWRLQVRFGDRDQDVFFQNFEVMPGKNLAFETIFHNTHAKMIEFTYDNDIEDLIPAVRYGPFETNIVVSSDRKFTLAMAAGGGNSAVSGILDFWSMHGLPEFTEGDFNFNRFLDANDIDILTSDIRNQGISTTRDLTNDGLANIEDLTKWIVDLKNTYFGDSNLDREFNSMDLISVFQANQYEDALDGNSTWSTGDWNGDAEFNSSDLVLAFQSGGYEQGPRLAGHSVPEPTLVSMLLPILVIVGRGKLHLRVCQNRKTLIHY